MSAHCFYFGCWNEAGHFMFAPGGRSAHRCGAEYFGDHVHIDGNLAPRSVTKFRARLPMGTICWAGQGENVEARQRIGYDSEECPQGQFLLHLLDNGFTAIQWWDRCQGDERSACNSTILLEGRRTAEEMVAAAREHFPHVLANLDKASVAPRDVTPRPADAPSGEEEASRG